MISDFLKIKEHTQELNQMLIRVFFFLFFNSHSLGGAIANPF